MCVSESWLNCDIFDSTIGVCGYSVVRADSPTGIRKHGVLIYIKRGISYSEIGVDIPNVLVLYLPNFDIYVMCVYRPPSSGLNDNVRLLEFIEQFCQDKEMIILGDFNLPSLHWNREDMLATYIPEFEMEFFNLFSQLGLVQVVNSSTNFPSGNVIDLCLCSFPDRVGLCNVLPPLPGCSHGVLLVHYVFQNNNEFSLSPGSDRLWARGSYSQMRDILLQVDWGYELNYHVLLHSIELL